MELRQLRYFVTIVDNGSISRAASVLHIAQPALSHQLQQLERSLSVSLLHRSSQGVALTDTGKKFYQHAQAILKQVLDAQASVKRSSHSPAGHVALGIPQSVSGVLALPLLKNAREQYPEITLQLTEELTGNLIEPVRSGRLNLAILFDERHYSRFSILPLIEEKLMFIGASKFLDRHDEIIDLATALRKRLILPDRLNGVRPIIDNAVLLAGLEEADIVEINSIAILRSALLAEIGATIAPASVLLADIESGALCTRGIGQPSLRRRLMLCASREIPLSDAAFAIQRLVRSVTIELCRQGAWPHACIIPV